jgi:hypothetical protein
VDRTSTEKTVEHGQPFAFTPRIHCARNEDNKYPKGRFGAKDLRSGEWTPENFIAGDTLVLQFHTLPLILKPPHLITPWT